MTEMNRLSPKVEQLLNRWQQESTRLKIEFSSKYISVLGQGIVRAVEADQILLDCDGCGYRIYLAEAQVEPPIMAEELPEKPHLTEKEVVLNQLQISVPDNQRVILSELE